MNKSTQQLVSIILSTYNRKSFLENFSIPSVLNQTYTNWELIIVDDFSNDGTEDVIEKFRDKINNLKYIKFSENKGYAGTINEGIKIARGDYIALLDADDAWLSNKLEEQIDFMVKNNLYASTCLVWEYDAVKKRLIGISAMGLPGFIAKKEIFNLICPLDPQLRGIEDGEFFIKLELLKLKNLIPPDSFQILNKPLVLYIRHRQALSYFDENKTNIIFERYKNLLRKYYFLLEDKSLMKENLLNIFYNLYTKYCLYAIISKEQKEAQIALKICKNLKNSFLNFVLKILLRLPPQFAYLFKKFIRNFLIESLIYKYNLLKFILFSNVSKEREEFKSLIKITSKL